MLEDHPGLAILWRNHARTRFNQAGVAEAFVRLEQGGRKLDTCSPTYASLLSLAAFDFAAADSVPEPGRLGGSNARGRLREAHDRDGLLAALVRVAFTRRAAEPNCRVCGLLVLGHAYEQVGAADSAIAVCERYLNRPHEERAVFLRLIFLGDSYERLASLPARRGNIDQVRHYLTRLIDLWKNPDPQVQPRVDAARRRLEALAPGGRSRVPVG